jgi:hypothetical protein
LCLRWSPGLKDINQSWQLVKYGTIVIFEKIPERLYLIVDGQS